MHPHSQDFTLRQKLGAILTDVPRYLYFFLIRNITNAPTWLHIRNRGERLESNDKHIGLLCDWQWTSDLYLPKIFPVFGRALFTQALRTYPINLQREFTFKAKSAPDVSFIIGHRGLERSALLLKTIESIAAQQDCEVECIVIEQDVTPQVKDSLPNWVTYIHTPIPNADTPYSRAAAFNAGVRHANANCLIFHDNDLLVPSSYAYETHILYKKGYEFINLKRFIFYLSQAETMKVLENDVVIENPEIDAIMQNAEGGGSVGASKTAFMEIGEFDERFIGWGGEDNEFWERAATKNVWKYTFMPLIHLWHPAQAGKAESLLSGTQTLYDKLKCIPPEDRIKNLTTKQ